MWNNTTDLTERLPQWMMTSFGIYLSTAVIIGSIANGAALFVFFSNKHLRSPTNVFIIGLLTSDFLMCTVATPFPAISNFAGRWLFGWAGCVFHGFAAYVLGLSNLYILSAIAVDRYIVIAKPLQAANINFRVVKLSVLVCYLFGLFWSSMPFFGWSSYVFEGAGLSCAISYEYTDPYAFSYSIAIFINCYLVPIFVMLYSYYFVYMTIRTMARNTAFDKKSRIAKRNMRIEKKMAKTIAMMIGVFVFCWTPYAFTAFYVAFGFGSLPVIAATIPSFFAKTASVWNPIIYVFTNKQFRRAFYDLIPCTDLRAKLVKKEEEKEAKSEESDVEDDKSKMTTKTSVTKIQIQSHNKRQPGVEPINEDDDAGKMTIVEDIRAENKQDETEMKDLSTSSQGAHKC